MLGAKPDDRSPDHHPRLRILRACRAAFRTEAVMTPIEHVVFAVFMLSAFAALCEIVLSKMEEGL